MKKKKKVEKENQRKKESQRNVLESGKQRKQKGRGWDIWVYMCGGEKSREKKEKKKREKRMDDRVERKK